MNQTQPKHLTGYWTSRTQEIYSLGICGAEMEAVAFSKPTIYDIIQKLPYSINITIYDIVESGKAKMAKVLGIISQQRAKAQAKATDATNNPPTGKRVSLHMGAPGTDGATSTQPATIADNSTHTYRYPSWAELCKPSGHV